MHIYKFTLLHKNKHVDFAVALMKQEPEKAIEIANLYIEKTLKRQAEIVDIKKEVL